MSCERARGIDLAAFLADRGAAEWADFREHYAGCPDCSRAVGRWTRLLAVVSGAHGGGGHPRPEELVAFEERPAGLEPERLASIREHVEGCRACRTELAVLREFDPSRVQRDDERPPPRRERRLSLSAPALALALLLVAVPGGYLLWRALDPAERPPAPSRTARVEPAPTEPPATEPAQVPEPAPAEEAEPRAERPPEPSPPPKAERPAEPPTRPAEEPRMPAPSETAPADREAPAREPVPDEPPEEPIRYRPDPVLAGGSLEPVRIAGRTRSGDVDAPAVRALGPLHVGATTRASPTLYWHLSGPSRSPVEVTLADVSGAEVLLRERLEPPHASGLQAVSLADRGVRLRPGTTYHWHVSLLLDAARPAANPTSTAGIRFVPPSPALREELAAAAPGERAHVLAAAGYWYDAFAALSRWLEARPAASGWVAQRAALLRQVELDEVAGALEEND